MERQCRTYVIPQLAYNRCDGCPKGVPQQHWYDPERRHSTLQYLSPQQYEQPLRQMARAAQTLCP